jgi:hypothetical protein
MLLAMTMPHPHACRFRCCFVIDNKAPEPAGLCPNPKDKRMGSVTFIKWLALCLIVLTAGSACTAQQKFPLRNGEWTSTTPDPTNDSGQPMTMLFCMNDETWAKALNHNPTCTI